jgi:hypothetical protein|tara:strand:- start:364 stop:534 length:171 start_codon:yes stop_codon:yes gene_type:complete
MPLHAQKNEATIYSGMSDDELLELLDGFIILRTYANCQIEKLLDATKLGLEKKLIK